MTRRVLRAVGGASIAVLFGAELVAAALLGRAFVARTASATPVTALLAGAALGAVLVFVSMAALRIAGTTLTAKREDRLTQERSMWTDRWIDVVFGDAEPPPGPLSRSAVVSLLDLRESLVGEPAEMVVQLMRDYGVESKLIERLDRLNRKADASSGHKTVIKPRHSLDRRLELLDDLGRVRTPMAVPSLLDAASDPEPEARVAGMRALARSVAAIPTEYDRRVAANEVLRALHDAGLSQGSLSEAMELLGPAAPSVVAPILERSHHYGNRMLVAAIDTAGHQRMNDLAPQIAQFASSRRAEIRVAALHALTKMERLPVAVASTIQKAFRDRNPAVRIEAARAAKLLETKTAISYLEDLLCDDDWTVRRVAATTLAGLGGPGIRTLIATSLVHGDHRARSTATQVLVESRSASELELEPEKVG